MSDSLALERLVSEVRACTRCTDLPLGPRPVLRVSSTARLLIASQAPSTRVHATGIPWNDASGQRLRQWLDMPPEVFYNVAHVAIVPMGLCYPGRLPQGGDRPPRPECAPLWQSRLLALMPRITLTLLIGTYAMDHTLGAGRMGERVRHYADFLPRFFPLPHPSWRTTGWERANPWFGAEVLPALRREVARVLGT